MGHGSRPARRRFVVEAVGLLALAAWLISCYGQKVVDALLKLVPGPVKEAFGTISGAGKKGLDNIRAKLKGWLKRAAGTTGWVPQGAIIVRTDPAGRWLIYRDQGGRMRIQFDVSEASNLAKGPLGPSTGSPKTGAFVGSDGKVVVVEGMHRLEAAQAGTQIPAGEGGIPGLPGWLEYDLWPRN